MSGRLQIKLYECLQKCRAALEDDDFKTKVNDLFAPVKEVLRTPMADLNAILESVNKVAKIVPSFAKGVALEVEAKSRLPYDDPNLLKISGFLRLVHLSDDDANVCDVASHNVPRILENLFDLGNISERHKLR